MRISIAIFVCFIASTAAAQDGGWVLPNFSDRVDVLVGNPTSRSMDTLAVLSISQIRSVAPDFPGTLAIAASGAPTRFLASQVDDLNGDGQPDEIAISVSLAPHEKWLISIYYSTTLHQTLPAAKRVHASHSYGYNDATAALESELIGYRTYGGFFFDVQAHARGQVGLFNSLIGFARISAPPIEGQDVVHLGDTLGLGGLFVRSQGKTYRPPLNTPDYTHRAPKPDEPVYRIVAEGPLRAIIEAQLPFWKVGDDAVSLRAVYEMPVCKEQSVAIGGFALNGPSFTTTRLAPEYATSRKWKFRKGSTPSLPADSKR